MFTEDKAAALVLAEQLVQKARGASSVTDYTSAISKVKAVLRHGIKDKATLLAERTRFSQNSNSEKSSSNLSALQAALTNFCVAKIEYNNEANKTSSRLIEPFALVSTQDAWLLIA